MWNGDSLPETFLSKNFQYCLCSSARSGLGVLGFLCFCILLVFINTYIQYEDLSDTT